MDFFNIVKRGKHIVTAPHCSALRLDFKLLRGSADRGTDMIAHYIGVELDFTVVTAKYSRFVLDFNAPKEKAIPTEFHDHEIPEVSVAEKRERLYEYDAYYAALGKLVTKGCLHIALHSMYPVAPKNSRDEGNSRPDFRLGTLHGKTIADDRVEMFAEALRNEGYSVELNNVFSGREEIKQTHALGAQSLQVEINAKHLLDMKNDCTDLKKVVVLMGVLRQALHALL